jgi:hypothetical protein
MNYGRRTMSVRQLYILTLAVAILGAVAFSIPYGFRSALAFLLGSAVSLFNLWLFSWLARAIEPGAKQQKPWEAGAFVGRYLILFTFGYVIVKSLGVSPLPVVLGLFASTAAVLLASLLELAGSAFGSRRT